jgi:ABC-type transport system involved in multi-copper enzyme maturation permease subunit
MNLAGITFRWALRDRLLHALLGVSLLVLLMVPLLSTFSMRQVQELSITLSLSATSFTLLVLSILLGASSIWRDVERRYTMAVLTLPMDRASYVLGKFVGAALLIGICSALLSLASFAVIVFASAQYPSEIPIHWSNLVLAATMNCLKYILLATVALFFSCISTSFFLPFFATISMYLAGSASQEVFEYISGEFGRTASPAGKLLVQGAYYLLPNFSAFNLQVQAIYGLPIPAQGLLYTFLYFLVYTALVLALAVWVFSRRELP